MPWDFNNPSETEEFKNLAVSKGMGLDEVDSFIKSKNPVPGLPNLSLDQAGTPLIPEAMPQTPDIAPQETLATAPIEPIPIQPTEPAGLQDMQLPGLGSSGFSMGDMLPPEQKQGLQDLGGQVPQQTNDLGQPPSVPSRAGQDAPLNNQQMIPAPSGSAGKVDFQKSVPQGHQFRASDGPEGLGGQCAWFSQQISKLPSGEGWTIGSNIQDKRNQLAGHVKNGNAFMRGQEQPKAGNSVVMDTGTKWGHVATVNEVMPDGRLKLSESNWNNDLRVTHDRIVDPNDPSIMGFMKTVPNRGRK